MLNITVRIILLLLFLIFIYCSTSHNYKKINNTIEKMLFIICILVITVPIIIYTFDYFDLFSLLNLTSHINAEYWTNFLSNYLSSIAGGLVSALFLIFVTQKQLDRTFEDNKLITKEESRLNNLPLFKYSLVKNCKTKPVLLQSIHWNNKNTKNAQINLNIKNVGMNSARKCYIEIYSLYLVEKNILKVGNQSIIAAGESKTVSMSMPLKPGGYTFYINVYYQDLLFNSYKQNIVLHYTLTNKYKNNQQVYSYNIRVEDEYRIQDFNL